jgi:hypothetical protein
MGTGGPLRGISCSHGGQYEDGSFGLCHVVWKVADVLEVLTLMMEAVSTYKTSVSSHETTLLNILENNNQSNVGNTALSVWLQIEFDF